MFFSQPYIPPPNPNTATELITDCKSERFAYLISENYISPEVKLSKLGDTGNKALTESLHKLAETMKKQNLKLSSNIAKGMTMNRLLRLISNEKNNPMSKITINQTITNLEKNNPELGKEVKQLRKNFSLIHYPVDLNMFIDAIIYWKENKDK